MKSFTGQKIPSAPAKTARRLLISAQRQLEKLSIADGVPAFDKARELHTELRGAIELATELCRHTR